MVKELKYWGIREWFAKQAMSAVEWSGFSWFMLSHRHDVEAMSVRAHRPDDFQRRYSSYAQMLPKMLERRDTE